MEAYGRCYCFSGMTDLEVSAERPGKRARLVEGARLLLHQQGVEKTTLADIAHASGVPVGNVYYYFKTKDELVTAAIDAHAEDIQAMLDSFSRHRGARAQLKAFIRAITAERDIAARYGCPHGTLCSELDKRDDDLGRFAHRLMRIPIDWAEERFRALGRSDAPELAVALVAAYQGISLLTNTFRDPALMTREARRLERWIDSLS